MQRERLLMTIYKSMLKTLGPSRWWPGETPFEVAVGAILTQNTNWSNVEKAITALKSYGALTPQAMHALPDDVLGELIRPSGYYNIKTKRLRGLLHWLFDTCEGDLAALAALDMESVRNGLLSVKGIGPETADAITLYAAGHPTFVVDAYTYRIFTRHGLVPEGTDYHELRDYFMDVLPPDVPLFSEYHALIVRVGKDWCRKSKPRCSTCPLGSLFDEFGNGNLPEGAA